MRAMVLCAGYGTRLGELTRVTPKPMLVIEGRPLLEYILRHLAEHGYNQIAINLHYKPETIQEYFGDGSRFGVELVYSYEEALLGTAGGVKRMASFLCHGEAFLVHYGDILTNQDFTSMLNFHRRKQALVTLLLHQRAESNSVVTMDEEGRISKFIERPDEKNRPGDKSAWVNSGVAICAPRLLELIPQDEFCDLPRNIYTKLVSSGQLYGFPLNAYRCAIDSPERLAEARATIARKTYRFW
jgi:mannose-1-phosphate guanylyltransferase